MSTADSPASAAAPSTAAGPAAAVPAAPGGPPVPVDTVIAGGWLLTMNPGREIYRAGGIAIDGGIIVAAGQRADILARFAPRRLIDAPDGVIMPGLVNGHRHLPCCAKGAMPEGGQTLDALRRFIYPSFAALTEQDMYVHAQHAAAEMIRFGTTLFEEPGWNHLDAVLEALASSGIRARTGPWTWDQAGPAGAKDLPDWLRMDAVPYGGFRLSGFGKELGREALDAYLQTKTVWVDLS